MDPLTLALEQLTGRRPDAKLDPAAEKIARRLIHAGRSAVAAPQPGRSARRAALRIFRDAHRAPRSSVLRIVLDSLSTPAPALRNEGRGSVRFLRIEGACTVDLQVRRGARGFEVRGQVEGASVHEVQLGQKRANVDEDGLFVMRAIPAGTVTLRIGDAAVEIDL